MTQMINAETNSIEVDTVGVKVPAYKPGNVGAGIPARDTQPPGATKKTALRDLQNQNGVLAQNHQENFSVFGGAQNTDTIKVGGSKRLTPEHPSSSPLYPALSNSCASEHIMNARRRFELELGGGKIQSNVHKTSDPLQSRQLHQFQQGTLQKQTQLKQSTNYCVPVSTANTMTPPMTYPSGGASAPLNFPVQYGFGMPAAPTDSLKVTLESPNSIAFKGTDDEQRTGRFVFLQKFLKECDESKCRDCTHMFQHLSPADLSSQAVELEKRAIQLTIEEGKEMQRMKALNVLGKCGLTDKNSLQTTQLLHPRK